MTNSRIAFRLSAGAGLVLMAALLPGCVNETALDDLREATPSGSAFNQALFKDYAALARSFGSVGAAAGIAFDGGGSLELTDMDSDIGALANSYASKALVAARGSVVEPDPGVDVPTHKMRDRLIRALDRNREAHPADAARAQADYDCWMMNATVAAMAASSKKCRASLEISLARLERETPAVPATPAPAAAAAAAGDSEKPSGQP